MSPNAENRPDVERLQALLDLATPPHLPVGLRQRVLAARQSPQGWRGWWAVIVASVGGGRVLVPALASSLLLGLALGLWFEPSASGSADLSDWAQYGLDDDGVAVDVLDLGDAGGAS